MVRLISLIILIGSFLTFGQEQFIRQGTLKASATIAPSNMLNRDANNIYLNGFIAYQLDKHLSLRGETFFYVNNAISTNPIYTGAIHTYFGAFYHKGKNNWDNYLGIQPGLSVVKTAFKNNAVLPTFAFKIGTAYYVWKYFHFFAELTYTNSSIRGIALDYGSIKTDELIISAGLGFQINTKKK